MDIFDWLNILAGVIIWFGLFIYSIARSTKSGFYVFTALFGIAEGGLLSVMYLDHYNIGSVSLAEIWYAELFYGALIALPDTCASLAYLLHFCGKSVQYILRFVGTL